MKVSDLPPTVAEPSYCYRPYPKDTRWGCSLHPGHDGNHEARFFDGRPPIVWSDADFPERDELGQRIVPPPTTIAHREAAALERIANAAEALLTEARRLVTLHEAHAIEGSDPPVVADANGLPVNFTYDDPGATP